MTYKRQFFSNATDNIFDNIKTLENSIRAQKKQAHQGASSSHFIDEARAIGR
jgi:hypothetical protein